MWARIRWCAVGAVVFSAWQVNTSAAQDISTHNWSGIVLGAHLGAAFTSQDHIHENAPGNPARDEIVNQDVTNFIGGGTLGYRFQRNNWVFGPEVSYSFLDTEYTTRRFIFNRNRTRTMALEGLLTVTGQVGLARDHWLAYVKGGYAGGDIRTRGENTDRQISGEDTKFENGWTVGVGSERAITDSLSVGLTYDYIDIDGGYRNVPCVNANCRVGFRDVSLTNHNLMLRVNWTFNRRSAK